MTERKPLELVHYPALPPEPVPGTPEWVSWDKWRAWDDLKREEFRQRRSRRFTEAELSAELYRQVFIEAEMEVRGRKQGSNVRPEYVEAQRLEARRSVIVERFAFAPDYMHDEEQAVTA